MGLFDSYHIAWGDAPLEIQTKQLESFMENWRVGDRIALGDLDSDEIAYGSTLGVGDPRGAPFCCIVEDASLARSYPSPKIYTRYFALGHYHGRFADYAAAGYSGGGSNLARALVDLWESPFGSGLARQSALVAERNERAWRSLAEARTDAITMRASWRKDRVEKKAKAKEPDLRSDAFAAFLAYRGPDFVGVSVDALDEAFGKLTEHWSDRSCEFDLELRPQEINTPAAKLAIAISNHGGRRGFFGSRLDLGEESPQNIGARSEPRCLIGEPTGARALALLECGQWRLFEHDAKVLKSDKEFIVKVKNALERLCLSRLGASWAAGFMGRHPEMMIEGVKIGETGQGHSVRPLADWLVVHMGLSTRLIEPLLNLGATASPEFALHCIGSHHGALFDLAVERAGGLAKVGSIEDDSLGQIAIRLGSLAVLKSMGAEGLLSTQRPEALDIGRAAFEIEANMSHLSHPDFSALAELPPSLACAVFMFDQGHRPAGAVKGETRLAAYLAWRERVELEAMIAPAPTSGEKKLRI